MTTLYMTTLCIYTYNIEIILEKPLYLIVFCPPLFTINQTKPGRSLLSFLLNPPSSEFVMAMDRVSRDVAGFSKIQMGLHGLLHGKTHHSLLQGLITTWFKHKFHQQLQFFSLPLWLTWDPMSTWCSDWTQETTTYQLQGRISNDFQLGNQQPRISKILVGSFWGAKRHHEN